VRGWPAQCRPDNKDNRQAIETKYIGPTNQRGARIRATPVGGGDLMHNWNYSLGIEGNHFAAAEALRVELNWSSIKAGSATAKGYAFATSLLEDVALEAAIREAKADFWQDVRDRDAERPDGDNTVYADQERLDQRVEEIREAFAR
jgi:hypothetical protein